MSSERKKENEEISSPGGESSADYIISESGEQQEQEHKERAKERKGTGLSSIADTLKEKVTETGKSVKETVTGGTGNNADDKTSDLESAQKAQGKIGEAASDPGTTGPAENVREKAAKAEDESQDSAEPA